jgi:hypothetical protein
VRTVEEVEFQRNTISELCSVAVVRTVGGTERRVSVRILGPKQPVARGPSSRLENDVSSCFSLLSVAKNPGRV